MALLATPFLLLGALALSGPAVGAAASPSGGDWTTYGGNNARTALQPRSAPLRPLRHRWTSVALDGAIYGQPLISAGHVYVATEANVVYELSASSGKVLWSRQLGAPVPSSALPCGDLSPTVGVTSTMVLDPGTGQLFASAAVLKAGSVQHELVALGVSSGKVEFTRDLDQPGWTAAAQLQRTGLTLASGTVYVGFGGNYGDCGSYRGWVVGVKESGAGPLLTYHVPTSNQGAIWAPSGLSANAAGDLYVSTGNSSSNSAFDGGDAVIELSPTLQEIGFFAPSNFATDNTDDLDLGSTATVLLPHGRAFIVGKEATGYLLNAARLGGVGGQLATVSVCNSRGGNAYAAGLLFIACPDGSMSAVRVTATSLALAWRTNAAADGSPVVAGGIVWSLNGSQLIGIDPRTGTELLAASTVQTEHFAAPSPGEGLLVIGGANQVEAFEGPKGYLGPR